MIGVSDLCVRPWFTEFTEIVINVSLNSDTVTVLPHLDTSVHTHTHMHVQVVGGRPPRHAPARLLPPWAPKRLAPPSRQQRSSSFPRPTCSHAYCCSCLTHQHGGEQSGLVTSISWPWKWYPSHVWRGLPLCQFWSS